MESIRETSERLVEEVQRGCKPRNLDTESRIVGGGAIPLVDVDAPKPFGIGRAKS